MPARIAKFPPIRGVGSDVHAMLPPSGPPPNPAMIPSYAWVVQVTTPAAGFLLSGKWSWHRVTTEGIGNVLMGHDWGMGQPHLPVPPLTSPTIALRTLQSSVKYWLPSTPNKEPQDGSPPGVPGPEGSVAVSTPAFVVTTQDCMDVAGWGFVAPMSVCFQLVSTREVGFTLGDLVNGAINMAYDGVAAAASSAFGGPPGNAAEELQSAIVGAAVNASFTALLSIVPPDQRGVAKIFLAPASALGGGQGASGAASACSSAALGWAAGQVGGAAQEAIDSDDRGPDEGAMEHGGTPLFD